MAGSWGFLRQLWSFYRPSIDGFLLHTTAVSPFEPMQTDSFQKMLWAEEMSTGKVTKCYKVLRWYQQLTTERSGSFMHSCTPNTGSQDQDVSSPSRGEQLIRSVHPPPSCIEAFAICSHLSPL